MTAMTPALKVLVERGSAAEEIVGEWSRAKLRVTL